MNMIGLRGMKLSSAAQRAAGNYSGILTRLRRDTSGNTLAMIAMATIPLAGMVGSAVDIGRSYLIKSRLQQACDAGVLAARRSMVGATLDSSATQQGNRFFAANFANDTAGSTNVSFSPSNTADGQVTATANARVPMTITKIFGTEYLDLSVSCDAKLQISNTDVMMVLDTTGSMAYTPDNNTYVGNGAGSKIAALRESVVDFYDTVNSATSSEARFRIGFVAYSSAVNMGTDPFTDSPILPTNWMVDSWTYQSRVANMDRPGWTPTTNFSAWTNQTHSSTVTNNNCNRYGSNQSFSGYSPANTNDAGTNNSNPNNVQPPVGETFQDTQPYDQRRVYERVTSSWSSGSRSCTRRWRVATTTYVQTGRYGFSSWDYKPVTYNVANYRSGSPVSAYFSSAAPTGSVTSPGSYNMIDLLTAPGSTIVGGSTVFDGCVEERSGLAQLNFSPIPADSEDLDTLNAPTSDNRTKWRPMWPELVYYRDANNGLDNEIDVTTSRNPMGSACPSPSSKLAVRAQSDVQSYVDSLVPTGGTYHDFGMAWGARLLSPTGMWASENSTAPNGRPISRHIIFMTDGILEPTTGAYSSQGTERSDRRVVGTGVVPTGGAGGTMAPYHNARFIALCNAARANNMVVWTINFSTATQPTLTQCADSGKAFTATNAAQLQAQFQAIASQIAELRLAR